MLKFESSTHTYSSIVPDGRKWLSITKIVDMLTLPFTSTPEKCSVRKPNRYPNKWYGLPPAEIQKAWDDEKNRSIGLGHWYHDKMEHELLHDTTRELPVHGGFMVDGIKIARDQRLTDGIYPEHIVYLETAGICGQTDRVDVSNGWYTVSDHKTCKDIKRVAFSNWEGPKMMLPPVQHLQDCEFNHYALQLSLYSFIIGRHNPSLKLKEQVINHVKFEQEGVDKYQYPIYRKDSNGEYIVKDIEKIVVPYLSREVGTILDWLRQSNG